MDLRSAGHCGEEVATPILMLTAKGQVDDVVPGLELGADDYLVKPFSLRELDARVKVLARRIDGGKTRYEFANGGVLNLRARVVTMEGEIVDIVLPFSQLRDSLCSCHLR